MSSIESLLLLREYYVIFVIVVVAIVISFVLFFLSYGLILRDEVEIDKVYAYECGFDPFEDTRTTFDVRFYLVGLLFLIFDLEIVFLFPWVVVLWSIGTVGFWSMVIFLIVLVIGFIYEWQSGVLDW